MNDDRELLELAAKAVGTVYVDGASWDEEAGWNPLEDDADALRLAVQLRLTPMMRAFGCDTTDLNGGASAYERWGKDPFAATRRAIVRAAAEIGRRQP